MRAAAKSTAQQTQTILIVESDEATRRILDLSLRHAGFAVAEHRRRRGGDAAVGRTSRSRDRRRRRSGRLRVLPPGEGVADGIPPAVVLISASDLESKRQGSGGRRRRLRVRPIYVQEVVARARALLQRRERERLELSAQRNHRFVEHDRRRAAGRSGAGHRRQPEVGRRAESSAPKARAARSSSGRGASSTPRSAGCRVATRVYRLFCWSSGRLEVEWKSIRRKDTIEMPPHDLLMEALRRVDDWRRLLASCRRWTRSSRSTTGLLAERLADIPDEVNRILRLFDGMRTFMQVIDDCGLPDLDARRGDRQAVSRAHRPRRARPGRTTRRSASADMEGWLSDAAGPFRAQPRVERDLFGAGAGGGRRRSRAAHRAAGSAGRRRARALDDDMRSAVHRWLAAGGSPRPKRRPTRPRTVAAAAPACAARRVDRACRARRSRRWSTGPAQTARAREDPAGHGRRARYRQRTAGRRRSGAGATRCRCR